MFKVEARGGGLGLRKDFSKLGEWDLSIFIGLGEGVSDEARSYGAQSRPGRGWGMTGKNRYLCRCVGRSLRALTACLYFLCEKRSKAIHWHGGDRVEKGRRAGRNLCTCVNVCAKYQKFVSFDKILFCFPLSIMVKWYFGKGTELGKNQENCYWLSIWPLTNPFLVWASISSLVKWEGLELIPKVSSRFMVLAQHKKRFLNLAYR